MEHRHLLCGHCATRYALTTCSRCGKHTCFDCAIGGLCFDCYRRRQVEHSRLNALLEALGGLFRQLWARHRFLFGLTTGCLVLVLLMDHQLMVERLSAEVAVLQKNDDQAVDQLRERQLAIERGLAKLGESASAAAKELSSISEAVSCDLTGAVWRSHRDPLRSYVYRSRARQLLYRASWLVRSSRIVPSVRDGKPEGFKLYAIRPCSIYEAVGLQNGDVILRINDIDLTTPDKALTAYSTFRGRQHTIRIRRRGRRLTLKVTIID